MTEIAAVETTSQDQPANERSRWIALIVLCVGFLMIILDQTIVNVALPSIQSDLGFSQSSLAWVVNAYLIAFGGLLLLAGRLGDLIGRRRIFMVGLAVFVAASALCGLAQSQSVLVGARFVQGIGGALTSAVILGMIVTMFPEPRERAKAIGVYSFVAAAGASIGLMLGVYTIVETTNYGWGSLHTLGLGALAVALLGSFIVRESRATTPLVPLGIFRSRNMAGANLIQALMVAGMFGMFFLGAIYLQRVLGYTALEVGLAFLPVAVLIGALSLGVSARLNMRFGARATLVPALSLMAGGLVLFSRAPVDASYVSDILPAMVLLGTGAGLAFPSLMTLAMSSATQEDSGLASGLVNTTLQVGGALGLAVIATLSTTRTENLLAGGDSQASALTGGFHLAFLIGAGLVLAALAV